MPLPNIPTDVVNKLGNAAAGAAIGAIAQAIGVKPPSNLGSRRDPQGNFNFVVELDGVEQGRFQEVSGLSASIKAIDFQSGPDVRTRKIPGKAEYVNITLKRGLLPAGFSGLWTWCENVLKGRQDRRSGSIVLMDDQGSEKMRFNFYFGFPVKWTGFSLNSNNQGQQTIEELEITVEQFEKA
jgi:phage tail-like protein